MTYQIYVEAEAGRDWADMEGIRKVCSGDMTGGYKWNLLEVEGDDSTEAAGKISCEATHGLHCCRKSEAGTELPPRQLERFRSHTKAATVKKGTPILNLTVEIGRQAA